MNKYKPLSDAEIAIVRNGVENEGGICSAQITLRLLATLDAQNEKLAAMRDILYNVEDYVFKSITKPTPREMQERMLEEIREVSKP
jgi:hypothetical protein